ncbi:hypothetical protein QL093DRAFT_1213156 [Fusarium oxysporum]|nr:hypothetical protein QL093DRAFT_1213156 [Fusarium oxysporum]
MLCLVMVAIGVLLISLQHISWIHTTLRFLWPVFCSCTISLLQQKPDTIMSWRLLSAFTIARVQNMASQMHPMQSYTSNSSAPYSLRPGNDIRQKRNSPLYPCPDDHFPSCVACHSCVS